MTTNRIIRILIGLALVGYAVYSGNEWFYLGLLPLITGIINWCPLELKMGTCDPASGCCATPESSTNSACCAPAKDMSDAKITSFKPVTTKQDGSNTIEILGTGCAKCVALEKVVNEVVDELGADYTVKKVSDIQDIMAYNVVSTPGLVINGTVVSTGKLLTTDEVKKLLEA